MGSETMGDGVLMVGGGRVFSMGVRYVKVYIACVKVCVTFSIKQYTDLIRHSK